MSSDPNKYTTTLLIFAALVLLWGILGMLDAKNYTNAGYSSEDRKVIEVEDGSPAEAAGMQVGDVIKSIDGIAIEDVKALSRRERTKIGQTREFVVDRAGEELTLPLTYGPMSSKNKSLNLAGFIISLLFVFFGCWAFLKKKTTAALLFAVFALCFGFNFANGPYISSHLGRSMVNAVTMPIILFGFAALVNFMLRFPWESSFLQSKNSRLWLYLPAAILVAIIWVLIFVEPDQSTGLNTMMRILFALFVLFYFGWALLTLIRNYKKATPAERSTSGLSLMLWGAIIGLVPILIIVLINMVAPTVIVPGGDYFFLTFGLIPILFALAVVRHKEAEPVAQE
jgi:hypothetical protein